MKLKISNVVYEIRLVDDLKDPEGTALLGRSRVGEPIFLERKSKLHEKENTLLHEVLHIIDRSSSVVFKESEVEIMEKELGKLGVGKFLYSKAMGE